MRLALSCLTLSMLVAACGNSDESDAQSTGGTSGTDTNAVGTRVGTAGAANRGGNSAKSGTPSKGGSTQKASAGIGGNASGGNGQATTAGIGGAGGVSAGTGGASSSTAFTTGLGGSSKGGASGAGGATTKGGASAAGGTTTAKGGASAAGGTTTAKGGASAAGGTTAQSTTVGGAVSYTGAFPAGLSDARQNATLTVDGKTRDVLVYRPSTATASPALFILYHGTGGLTREVMDQMKSDTAASQHGFVVAAPAAKLNQQGGAADVDHWEDKSYASGWNLVDQNPTTNDDARLTRAIIDAASKAYGIDRKRVYTAGMSNGAFYSPMVALMLPNEIAGFAEQSGGAIRTTSTTGCQNRGGDGAQWVSTTPTASLSCAALESESTFPSCTGGALKPVPVPTTGRVPRGYLVHFNTDTIVSVAWTCHLADAMGANATTKILYRSGFVHLMEDNFLENAWTALSGYSVP